MAAKTNPKRTASKAKPANASGEVVCFTAGFHGASFAAGCIHAYLAADRPPPEIVAGVSMGAVNAAAMEEAYRHLREAPDDGKEEARWEWYRNYLEHLTFDALRPVWDSLPSLIDFYSERAPVWDLSTPHDLTDSAAESNRRRQLQIYAGQWLSRLRLRFNCLANLVTSYVRLKEAYPELKVRRRVRLLIDAFRVIRPLIQQLASLRFIDPGWLGEISEEQRRGAKRTRAPGFWHRLLEPKRVRPDKRASARLPEKLRSIGARWPSLSLGGIALAVGIQRFWIDDRVSAALALTTVGMTAVYHFALDWRRPLLGWPSFLGAWLLLLSPIVFVVSASLWFVPGVAFERGLGWTALLSLVIAVLGWGGLGVFLWAIFNGRFDRAPSAIVDKILWRVGLPGSLIHDYHLRRKLRAIFQWPNDHAPTEDPAELDSPESARSEKDRPKVPLDHDGPAPRLLIVVTALQARSSRPNLSSPRVEGGTWKWWRHGTDLIDALRSALAWPPILEPSREPTSDGPLDVVDASLLRRNPLPALFHYLSSNRSLGVRLAAGAASSTNVKPQIIVVYNVPIKAPPPKKGRSGVKGAGRGSDRRGPNLIDVGTKCWRLSARRDTQDEVKQTDLIGKLEEFIWKITGTPNPEDVEALPLVTAEVAPERDIAEQIQNPLDPKMPVLLENVAAGCRKTLETLYAEEIKELEQEPEEDSENDGELPCRTLLARVASGRQELLEGSDGLPGLPEVCRRCSGRLMARPKPQTPSGRRGELDPSEHPQLTGTIPRIVVANSGGVFRGAFHIGMNGALLAARMKPDLIAGASVGTLIGGALAASMKAVLEDGQANGANAIDSDATTSAPLLISAAGRDLPKRALKQLSRLVDRFVHADRHVALTHRLKSAFRDIGVRSRNVRLSPKEIRRLVKRGARSDPGFAATGAPPALIDAFSALSLIPIRATAVVAANVVSGHVARALFLLSILAKRDALRRLNIVEELMDTSLLARTARELLDFRDRETRRQPFADHEAKNSMAFLATATHLDSEEIAILGGRAEKGDAERFDFLEAALASSAFPGFFRTRRQSEIYPGHGDPDVRFSDGGMFDNLPIITALRTLSRIQPRRASQSRSLDDAVADLERRHQCPDLILIGALQPDPRTEEVRGLSGYLEIRGRARRLKHNMKIEGFERSTSKVDRQVERLVAAWRQRKRSRKNQQWLEQNTERIDELVSAAILPIYPSSPDHLNGTFAFCNSTGLREDRIQCSIADGCFRTLAALSGFDPQGRAFVEEELPAKALRGLRECDKLPKLRLREKEDYRARKGICPYFVVGPRESELPFKCPFASCDSTEADGVYKSCTRDREHRRWHKTTYPRQDL